SALTIHSRCFRNQFLVGTARHDELQQLGHQLPQLPSTFKLFPPPFLLLTVLLGGGRLHRLGCRSNIAAVILREPARPPVARPRFALPAPGAPRRAAAIRTRAGVNRGRPGECRKRTRLRSGSRPSNGRNPSTPMSGTSDLS